MYLIWSFKRLSTYCICALIIFWYLFLWYFSNAYQNSSEKLKIQLICKASEKYVGVDLVIDIFCVPKCYILYATQFEKNLYHQHCLLCAFDQKQKLCSFLGKVTIFESVLDKIYISPLNVGFYFLLFLCLVVLFPWVYVFYT